MYEKEKALIEKELGYSCEVKVGSKNSDWLRINYSIKREENKSLQDCSEDMGYKFSEFVYAFKKYLKIKK